MLVTLKDVLKSLKAKMCDRRFHLTESCKYFGGSLGCRRAECSGRALMHAQSHESYMPLEVVGPILLREVERSSVPSVFI